MPGGKRERRKKMQCPKCGVTARVVHVDESGEKISIAYVCPNPRCAMYKKECAQEERVKKA